MEAIMTHLEVLDAMGSMATDEEADAMAAILSERSIESLNDISDETFFALIPDAIERAKGVR